MQYVDCDRAEKHGNLCLGYGYEEIDEPCEQCQNCLKCESGTYQLGETEKDDQLTTGKEIIERLLATPRSIYGRDEDGEITLFFNSDYEELKKRAEQFLKEIEK